MIRSLSDMVVLLEKLIVVADRAEILAVKLFAFASMIYVLFKTAGRH